MTNKEAREILGSFDFIKNTYGDSIKTFNTHLTALCLAVKALEKQVGKKPKLNGLSEANCPNLCGNYFYEVNYCSKCGQKLDWSE